MSDATPVAVAPSPAHGSAVDASPASSLGNGNSGEALTLHAYCRQLQTKNAELLEQKSSLASDNAKLKCKVVELEARVQDVEEQLDEKERQRLELSTLMQERDLDDTDMIRERQELCDNVADYDHRLKEALRALEVAEVEIARLQELLEQRDGEFRALSQQHGDALLAVRNDQDEMREHTNRLAQQLDASAHDVQKYQWELRQKETLLDASQKSIESLQEQLSQIRGRAANVDALIDRLPSQDSIASELRAAVATLKESDVAEADRVVRELRDVMSNSFGSVERARAETETRRHHETLDAVQALQRDIAEAGKQRGALSDLSGALQRELTQATAERAKLLDEFARSQREHAASMEALQQALAGSESGRKEAESRLVNMLAVISHRLRGPSVDEIDGMRSRLLDSSAAVKQLRDQTARDLNELRASLMHEFEVALAGMAEEHAEQVRSVRESYTSQVSSQQALIRQLEEKCDTLAERLRERLNLTTSDRSLPRSASLEELNGTDIATQFRANSGSLSMLVRMSEAKDVLSVFRATLDLLKGLVIRLDPRGVKRIDTQLAQMGMTMDRSAHLKRAHQAIKTVIVQRVGDQATGETWRLEEADILALPNHLCASILKSLQELVVAYDNAESSAKHDMTTAQEIVANAENLVKIALFVRTRAIARSIPRSTSFGAND